MWVIWNCLFASLNPLKEFLCRLKTSQTFTSFTLLPHQVEMPAFLEKHWELTIIMGSTFRQLMPITTLIIWTVRALRLINWGSFYFDKFLKYCTQFSGWWLERCTLVSLNGKYVPPTWHDSSGGLVWQSTRYLINPARTRMMLRKYSP
jgi:hypothetical protein